MCIRYSRYLVHDQLFIDFLFIIISFATTRNEQISIFFFVKIELNSFALCNHANLIKYFWFDID
jgi:hypothetical protein